MLKRVEGCGYYSWGLCLSKDEQPSLMVEAMRDSLSVLEGPVVQVKSNTCSAGANCALQKKCSSYKQRTVTDNERDLNI